jgi:hypothetical protein
VQDGYLHKGGHAVDQTHGGPEDGGLHRTLTVLDAQRREHEVLQKPGEQCEASTPQKASENGDSLDAFQGRQLLGIQVVHRVRHFRNDHLNTATLKALPGEARPQGRSAPSGAQVQVGGRAAPCRRLPLVCDAG